MGQLRSAVRALAVTGLAPGPLLERLDEYAGRHDVGKMCTLVYAELDLAKSTLRFACAGHLPPVLALPGEDPRFAWGGRSAPLAAFAPAEEREDSTEPFPPGSMVLLYTDGLVEERAMPVDHGMERMRSAVATHRNDTTAAILDEVLSVAPTSAHADDVCALVARASLPQS
jgi:serine/threonine-protein kinase RsbW